MVQEHKAEKPHLVERRAKRSVWRGWYGLMRWHRLARDQRALDRFQCRTCGILCVGRPPALNSPVCDHIEAHHGDSALFWNPDNLQTLCKRCHDGAKAAQEARGYGAECDADSWPIDPAHPANVRR